MDFGKNNSRLFDDLAQLAGGAFNLMTALRQQMREEARERVDSFTARMDLVTREDLKRIEGIVTKARLVQDTILKRLDALEGAKKKTTKKPSPKKTKARRK